MIAFKNPNLTESGAALLPQKARYFQRYYPDYVESLGSTCPVCGNQQASYGILKEFSTSIFQGWCPACSNFWVTMEAVESAKRQRKEHLLAAYFRGLSVEESSFAGPIGLQDLDETLASISELNTLDQFDRALKAICEGCQELGHASLFSWETDWPIITARSGNAASYIIHQLTQADFFAKEMDGRTTRFPLQPTWKAYQRLQELRATGRSSFKGFVAMSFNKDRFFVWKGLIEPAIIEAGYYPMRVDQEEHNKSINDYIIGQIRACRFLVADFTKQNQDVYFEAGFAMGLGREVIWICSHLDKPNLHFDTRHYNHIIYKDEELEAGVERLRNLILRLEGPGPDYKESINT